MEVPLRQKLFVPEPDKKTIPRQAKSFFERNNIGKRYLEQIYGKNEKAFGSRPKNLNRFETLQIIKEKNDKENRAKLEKWKKYREHQVKYDNIMRSVVKKVTIISVVRVMMWDIQH